MTSPIGLHAKRLAATLTALACVLCLLAAYAPAQARSAHTDEIFGGYSVLFPNGYGDLYPGFTKNFKPNTITNAFDASNTYYFCLHCNLGFVLDGSGHFNGTQNPVDPTGGKNGTAVGYLLGGLQYKYHTDTLSPFVRVLAGGADISPDCCGGTKWNGAVGVGGGLDLSLSSRFSLRLAQVDYIYSRYDHRQDLPSTQSTSWNSVRLAAGVVIGLGSCYTPPLSCTASASPTEVWAGEPVTLTATCKNFNPKHPTNYSWTTTGGTPSAPPAQTVTVGTTGMVPGSYTGTVTATDPKLKKNNSATSNPAGFVIKQPHAPEVTCVANPTTIAVGQSSTITMTATDPQGWPMTYNWSTTGGTLSGSGTTATLTATNADAGTTMTVTGTATDPRANMSTSCTVPVTSPQIVRCGVIEDWGECTFEKNPKKPWRVDNDCKDTLDKLSLRLQQMPNGKVNIVGYTNEKEVITEKTLGSQRSVNVKYYLTTDGPNKADASRIQPRDGGTKGQATHFYYVPEGCLQPGQTEEGVVVDETVVQPQSRNAPAPKKKAKKKAEAAAPPAQ